MKKMILILSLALIGVSCSKTESTATKQEPAATDGAAVTVEGFNRAEIDCSHGGRDTVHVTITVRDAHIQAHPAKREVCVGWTVQFTIPPTDLKMSVYVRPKDENDEWMETDNTRGTTNFSIDVPENLVIGNEVKEFGYNVEIPQLGNLDPVIIVRGGG